MDLKLLNKIADAGTDSRFWGSWAQEKAQEVLGLLAARSWCDDDFQAGEKTAWAEYEYAEFLKIMKNETKQGN